MVSELDKQLAALRKVAPRLNAAADEANRVVKMVETALVGLNLGVEAYSSAIEIIPSRRTEPPRRSCDDETVIDQETRRHLAFGRCQGVYCIHVADQLWEGSGRDADYVDETLTPWSSCDRETRLAAFEKLPELLDRLLKEATRVAEAAEKTAKTVRGMTADKGK